MQSDHARCLASASLAAPPVCVLSDRGLALQNGWAKISRMSRLHINSVPQRCQASCSSAFTNAARSSRSSVCTDDYAQSPVQGDDSSGTADDSAGVADDGCSSPKSALCVRRGPRPRSFRECTAEQAECSSAWIGRRRDKQSALPLVRLWICLGGRSRAAAPGGSMPSRRCQRWWRVGCGGDAARWCRNPSARPMSVALRQPLSSQTGVPAGAQRADALDDVSAGHS